MSWGEAEGLVELADVKDSAGGWCIAHPAVLDSALQGGLVALYSGSMSLPTGVQKLSKYAAADRVVRYGYLTSSGGADGGIQAGDSGASSQQSTIALLNAEGHVVAEVVGFGASSTSRLALQQLLRQQALRGLSSPHLYGKSWEERVMDGQPLPSGRVLLLVEQQWLAELCVGAGLAQYSYLLPDGQFYDGESRQWSTTATAAVLERSWRSVLYGWCQLAATVEDGDRRGADFAAALQQQIA